MPTLTLDPNPGRQWVVLRGCPDAWQRHLERCGGGYFHSPPGISACGVRGDPLYLEWREGQRVLGIAAGVHHACRLNAAPRHVYLPTLPATLNLSERSAALAGLINMLRANRLAEFVCDSAHAYGVPGRTPPPAQTRRRVEYVVRLDGSTRNLVSQWSEARRLQLQSVSGTRWSLTLPLGELAAETVASVEREAGPALHRPADDPFARESALDLSLGAVGLNQPWGRAVFAVSDGGDPLAFAIVGWANRRAYYLMGAATRRGRQMPVTTWLHWRIMESLRARGFTSYGLGGTRASAVEPGDDLHGLHCFRTGLGAAVVACAGARWVLDTAHDTAHHSPVRPIPVCAV